MNKFVKTGLVVLGVLAVGFVALQAKKYYEGTYVGSVYYLQVPAGQDTTMDTWTEGQDGQYEMHGKKYAFTAYSETGETKHVEFDITDNFGDITTADLLQPNEYVYVEASQARVIRWHRVPESEVPEEVLRLIQVNR